jgi:hypothetical protein
VVLSVIEYRAAIPQSGDTGVTGIPLLLPYAHDGHYLKIPVLAACEHDAGL